MTKGHKREPEKAEAWDFQRPVAREPVKASRVVVSVAFRREDFALVSEYAERVGKKISQFIREAALEKAGGQGAVYATGSIGVSWWTERPPDSTSVSGSSRLSVESEKDRWAFGCDLGLQQGTCGKFLKDFHSQGFKAGLECCYSCLHGHPANTPEATTHG